MTVNPFEGSGIEPTDGERAALHDNVHSQRSKRRLILGMVGSVLLVAGVVWKFVSGTADTESLSVLDFMWLVLIAVGGLALVVAARRDRYAE